MASDLVTESSARAIADLFISPFVDDNDHSLHGDLIREANAVRLQLCDRTDAALDAGAEIDDLGELALDTLKDEMEASRQKHIEARERVDQLSEARRAKEEHLKAAYSVLEECDRDIREKQARVASMRQAASLFEQTIPGDSAQYTERAEAEAQQLVELVDANDVAFTDYERTEHECNICRDELEKAEAELHTSEDHVQKCEMRVRVRETSIASAEAFQTLADARLQTRRTLLANILLDIVSVLDGALDAEKQKQLRMQHQQYQRQQQQSGGEASGDNCEEQPQLEPLEQEQPLAQEPEPQLEPLEPEQPLAQEPEPQLEPLEPDQPLAQEPEPLETEPLEPEQPLAQEPEPLETEPLEPEQPLAQEKDVSVASNDHVDTDFDQIEKIQESSDDDDDDEKTVSLDEDDDFDLNDTNQVQAPVVQNEPIDRQVVAKRGRDSGDEVPRVVKFQCRVGPGPRKFRKGTKKSTGDRPLSSSALGMQALRAACAGAGKSVTFESIKKQLPHLTGVDAGKIKNAIQRMSGTALRHNFAQPYYVNAQHSATGTVYCLSERGLAHMHKLGL